MKNAQEAGSLLKGNREAVDLGERRGVGGTGRSGGGEAAAGMYCMRQEQTKRTKEQKCACSCKGAGFDSQHLHTGS